MVDNGSDEWRPANCRALLLFETIAAKEAKKRQSCLGNPLGCYCKIGRGRIKVYSKWQFGHTVGCDCTLVATRYSTV